MRCLLVMHTHPPSTPRAHTVQFLAIIAFAEPINYKSECTLTPKDTTSASRSLLCPPPHTIYRVRCASHRTSRWGLDTRTRG